MVYLQERKSAVARRQRIKSATYRVFRIFVAPLLGGSFWAIRIKWWVALKLVGLEFHLENINTNRDKLLHYADPECPLNEKIVEIVSSAGDDTIAMLDAGCGPFSKTGNRLTGKIIIKELFDPMAEEYEAIYDQFQLPHKPRIKRGVLEQLSDCYPPDCFDIIHARNCIDHCYNPILAIAELLRALKPGGCIVMQHFLNEGERAAYYGLHQWNLKLINGDLFVANSNSSIRVNLTEKFRGVCQMEFRCDGEKLYCLVRKLNAEGKSG